MSRWMYALIAGLGLAACDSVGREAPDAPPPDAPPPDAPPPDAPPSPSLPPGSILAVHRVLDFHTGGDEVRGELENVSPRVLFLASASAQRAGAGSLSVVILVDGAQVAALESATNEADSPKALSRNVFVIDHLEPGRHTVTVLAQGGTTLGASDFVDLTVLELGADARVVPLFQNRVGTPAGAPLFSANLVTGGGTGILFVAGTGYNTPGTSATIGASVLLDDVPVGRIVSFTNETLSHKAFVPAHFVLAPGAGTHPFSIDPFDGTVVNQDDRINALWLELGTDAVATGLIATNGALPHAGTLTTLGGRVLFLASGSGYRGVDTAAIAIGGEVVVGDTIVARSRVHTRETLSHKAFVASAALAELPAGEHTVRFGPAPNTPIASDHNDYFHVTAIELGR